MADQFTEGDGRLLAGPRGTAQASFDTAMLSLIRAFNIAGNPDVPYTFDAHTTERVLELARELIAIFRDSELRPHRGALMQGDSDFQRFMAKSMGPGRQ